MRGAAVLGIVALGFVSNAQGLASVNPLQVSLPVCNGTSGLNSDGTACVSVLGDEYSQGSLFYVFNDPSGTVAEDAAKCTGAYVMPMLASELLWPWWLRTLFYFLLLCWCFIGVAIISDKFMAAIEVIASKERVVVIQNEFGEAEEKKVLVWDQTVANLSLMALGSSAPEILLSVVETLGTLDKEPEDGLGPSTIVGSAAFNLLVINAVCVAAIGKGEKRVIEGYNVFLVTAISSVWAYVWMYIVLQDEIVTIGEAIITFLFFPILLYVSYAVNNGKLFPWSTAKVKVAPTEGRIIAIDGGNHQHAGEGVAMKEHSSETSLVSSKRFSKMRKDSKGNIIPQLVTLEDKQREDIIRTMALMPISADEEAVAAAAASDIISKQEKSNIRYKIEARRRLVGGKGFIGKRLSLATNFVRSATSMRSIIPGSPKSATASPHPEEESPKLPLVAFKCASYGVMESAGAITIQVVRTSPTPEPLNLESKVFYETRSGAARAGEDYEHTSGVLVFAPGETLKEFAVKIIDDTVFEQDEDFSVVLLTKGDDHNADIVSGTSITTITIIDDDKPGVFGFENGGIVAKESDGVVHCTVKRTSGVEGRVKVAYKTVEATAKVGADFHEASGTLIFEPGVNEATFDVVLIDDKCYEKDATFAVELEILNHPECGAEYGEHKVLSITITSDSRYAETVDKISELMKAHLDAYDVGTTSWSEQLREALEVEAEEGEDPSISDCVLHILSFGWKVVFALVPPTSIAGGYLSFFVSLIFIGVITMVVGDIAGIFGCLLGTPPSLTAITFVALGTSLPDAFASKMAAENDSNADNSIGNVTGSNSVNVFLGLGLPWLIGSFYKASKGEDYVVKSGALSFSVAVFVSVAAIFFSIMYMRRKLDYGELGGPSTPKWLTVGSFVILWVIYVVLCGLQSLGHI